jgi:hypothetical protein
MENLVLPVQEILSAVYLVPAALPDQLALDRLSPQPGFSAPSAR